MSEKREAPGGVQTKEDSSQADDAYRQLFDLSPAGVMIVEKDGAVKLANPAVVRLLACPDESALSEHSLLDFIAPDHLEHCLRYLQACFIGTPIETVIETIFVRADGEHIPCEVVAGPLIWRGKPAVQVIIRDITEQKQAVTNIKHQADHDSLTDLFIRRRFEDEVDRAFATKRSGRGGSVLLLDIDAFDGVNYGLGHQAGDEVLKQVAAVLRAGKRKTDVLARISGDKFALLLPNTDTWRTQAIAHDLLERIGSEAFHTGAESVRLTASIGVALLHEHGAKSEELLSRADLALHQSKEKGGNAVCVFMPEENWQEQMESRLTWQRRIREALDNDDFVVYAQPIFDLSSNTVSHYELLLRLPNGHGVATPDSFIPIAEASGSIQQIDRWVVEQAIHLIAQHREAGRSLMLHVNVSGKSLRGGELVTFIGGQLRSAAIDPANLVVEITESAAAGDMDHARKFVRAINALGCQVALDDFGVGFSSFSHLQHLPVAILKIDGSFIRNLVDNPVDQSLVRAMVDVAQSLGMTTTAEYVGGPATVDLLRKLGVDFAQGYHIGEPQDVSQVLAVPAKTGQRAA